MDNRNKLVFGHVSINSIRNKFMFMSEFRRFNNFRV